MKKNLKRTLALALAACTLLALTVTTLAAGPEVAVTLDGQSVGSGAYVDSQNRTQIPNAMGEALGMAVTEEGGSATFAKDGKSITFQVGSNQAGDVTMDTQAVAGYSPLRYLADFFGYGISWDAASRTAALTSPVALSAQDVESIQAYTDMCFYGQKLTKVEITYSAQADLSKVSAAAYTLYDRGSANPNYVPAVITDVNVNGRVVTLNITKDSERTSERSRNSVGAITTGAWYIAEDGKLYYGKEDSVDPVSGDTYYQNTTGKGYQSRENLDLVLCHTGESFQDGLALTNGFGVYSSAEKWKPTITLTTDVFKLETVNVNGAVSKASGETYSAPGYEAFDGEVPVIVYAPADYASKSYPMVVYVCGGGTSYWELLDESGNLIANNPGTNLNFDAAMAAWLDEDVIIISPQVHSTDNTPAAREVAAVTEYYIEKLNADTDKIIMAGNSNGAALLSETLRMYPGLCDVFFPVNGDLGVNDPPEGVSVSNRDSLYTWTEEELKSLAETSTAIWFHTGETDTRHFLVCQLAYQKILPYYKAAGFSDEWIEDNIRISSYMSWQFKYWGESDHSCTRLVWGKYADRVYTDVYEGQPDLNPGDTYKLNGKEDFNYEGAENFVYKLYSSTPHDWALSRTK